MAITRKTATTTGTPPMWARAAAAAPTEGGGGLTEYFADGKYVVAVDNLEVKESVEGSLLIASFRVVDTNNSDIPIGDKRSYVRYMRPKMLSEIKTFFSTLCAAVQGDDFDPDADLSDFMVNAVGPEQPITGTELRLRVVTSPQKNDPSKTYTKHYFDLV